MEFGIAAAKGAQLTKSSVPIAAVFPVAGEVWNALLGDSELANLRVAHPWQLLLGEDGSLNASSLPNGQVIVSRGLGNLLGSSRGLWAAILSHEIAHVVRRHWERKYLFEFELRKQLESYENAPLVIGDARVQMAALGAQIDAPERMAKFAHDLEYEADCDGMMLMARTGYHPDFAFAARHLLRASSDEQPDSGGLFSTHPQWTARDQRSNKAYALALAEFQRRWPATASSPGGPPPTIGFVRDSKANVSADNNVTVTFSLRCTHQQDLKLALRVFRRPRKTQKTEELIEFVRPLSCSEREVKETYTVNMPADAPLDRSTLEAGIFLLNDANLAVETSPSIPIHIR